MVSLLAKQSMLMTSFDVLTYWILSPFQRPLVAGESLLSSGRPFDDPTLYRSLVDALQYLIITRPDLSYAVNQVSKLLHFTDKWAFSSRQRILHYVKGIMHFGLSFTHRPDSSIIGYSDADWAWCVETCRLTYGYSIILGGNLVSWSAKKKPTVCRSSCESKYRVMTNVATKIVWLTNLLLELHALHPDLPTLLSDDECYLLESELSGSHTSQTYWHRLPLCSWVSFVRQASYSVCSLVSTTCWYIYEEPSTSCFWILKIQALRLLRLHATLAGDYRSN